MSSDFGIEITKYAQKIGRTIDQTSRNIGMSLFKGVIMDTPVGEINGGRLRGNWNTSVGQPDYTTTDETDSSGSKTKEKVDAVLGKPQPNGAVFYLTNNLPYAKRREQEGGRPVVGATREKFGVGVGGGFVAKNMARIERNVKEAVADA